mmetsp:Transcript_60946/g.157604  ORF Transcript_60946/g.157604 Transcript_60946/m.157604 type:complete len:333 (+) Transcript_60946:356-1354(+)
MTIMQHPPHGHLGQRSLELVVSRVGAGQGNRRDLGRVPSSRKHPVGNPMPQIGELVQHLLLLSQPRVPPLAELRLPQDEVAQAHETRGHGLQLLPDLARGAAFVLGLRVVLARGQVDLLVGHLAVVVVGVALLEVSVRFCPWQARHLQRAERPLDHRPVLHLVVRPLADHRQDAFPGAARQAGMAGGHLRHVAGCATALARHGYLPRLPRAPLRGRGSRAYRESAGCQHQSFDLGGLPTQYLANLCRLPADLLLARATVDLVLAEEHVVLRAPILDLLGLVPHAVLVVVDDLAEFGEVVPEEVQLVEDRFLQALRLHSQRNQLLALRPEVRR